MRRRKSFAAAGALVVALSVSIAGCGGGDDDGLPSSTIPVPSVEGPTTAPGPTAQPLPELPCELPLFVDLMRTQGPRFELSPGVLAALTPIGEPTCTRGFASLSFNGPPDDPGPFAALFAIKGDMSGWDLFAVDCLAATEAGRRQVC